MALLQLQCKNRPISIANFVNKQSILYSKKIDISFLYWLIDQQSYWMTNWLIIDWLAVDWLSQSENNYVTLKGVRAHCYCASLVRTLYMTWPVPRHVFQARALNQNSTKYRAGGLCGNLICEYFCWMFGDPHFFFGISLPFLTLSGILKNKNNLYVGSFNYFSYPIQIGSNWYMDTGERNLEVACLKATILPELMT